MSHNNNRILCPAHQRPGPAAGRAAGHQQQRGACHLLADAGHARWAARPRSAHGCAMGWFCPHRLAGRGTSPVHAGGHWRRLGLARRRLTRVSETYGNHSLGSSQASEQLLLARWKHSLRRTCSPSRRPRPGAPFRARTPRLRPPMSRRSIKTCGPVATNCG